jgi:CBS domain-containing protein
MATVREVMSTGLYYVAPGTKVGEAVALMAQHRIGSVLVMEGDRLVGIFTERDTVRALSQTYDAPSHEVSSWMTANPITVQPETSIQDALRTMLVNNFRHLPVMHGDDVAGIVSIRDLAKHEASRGK